MQNTVNVTASRRSRGRDGGTRPSAARGDAGGAGGGDAGGDADPVAPSGRLPAPDGELGAGLHVQCPGSGGRFQLYMLGQYLVLSAPLFIGRKWGMAESSTTHVL